VEEERLRKAREKILQLFAELARVRGYVSSMDYATWISVVHEYLDKLVAGEVDIDTVIREATKQVQEQRLRSISTRVAGTGK
jgi:hypothetical protein